MLKELGIGSRQKKMRRTNVVKEKKAENQRKERLIEQEQKEM